MCVGHLVAAVLVTVGALNWGLVGGFNFNLVNTVLGSWPTVERVVYVLVGLAAIMMVTMGHCKKCGMGSSGSCCKDDAGASSSGHGGGCC